MGSFTFGEVTMAPANSLGTPADVVTQPERKGNVSVVSVPNVVGGPPADRPAWLPEKFKDPEAMAAAYTELERKLGAGQPPPSPAPAAPPAGAPAPVAPPQPAAGVTPSPVTAVIQAASDQFAATGALDEAMYKQLETAGIPKPVVDRYVADFQSKQAAIEGFVYNQFGGQGAFNAAVESARGKITPQEAAAFDSAIKSGDFGQISVAVSFLKARAGVPTHSFVGLEGSAGSVGGGGGFRNDHEFQSALKDPRYGNDSGYTQSVEDRLRASMR